MPVLSRFDCDSIIHQEDANTLADKLDEVDLAYLDPPYNQHPYGSNYFMLNLLLDYREPKVISRVSGIPADWQRSAYNRRAAAADALHDLLEHTQASHILISYNDEGFLTREHFEQMLSRFGHFQVLHQRYNAFRGSRNLHTRPTHLIEQLFLLERH